MIQMHRPSLGNEELKAIKGVFSSRWLGFGSVVEEFEDKLKNFLGAKNVIAVNSGTSALHIALDAFGIKKGDEV
ncbi:MAG: DegT/DnrJ/EryC1/StrS family aminotransferase, partial [Candidatus Omnitrophota bacterium]